MNEEALSRLRARIAQHRIEKYQQALLASAKPALKLATKRADESTIPVGATKFGGHPDLPNDQPWPTYNGRTIRFLAQINLGEMPAAEVDNWPLPTSGLLSFWYDTCGGAWGFDPKDAGSFQVLSFPDAPAGLSRRPYPEFVLGKAPEYPMDDWGPFDACTVGAEAVITVQTDILLSKDDPRHIADGFTAFEEEINGQAPLHRLLGNPVRIQGEMDWECQLASNGFYCGSAIPESEREVADEVAQGARDWCLLLQIDTDDAGPDWMWGDAGMLYYWIRTQELARGDFSRVWGILQCY
jgi:uncharacterized protein YwqG